MAINVTFIQPQLSGFPGNIVQVSKIEGEGVVALVNKQDGMEVGGKILLQLGGYLPVIHIIDEASRQSILLGKAYFSRNVGETIPLEYSAYNVQGDHVGNSAVAQVKIEP